MRDPLFDTRPDTRPSAPRPSDAQVYAALRAVRLWLWRCKPSRGMFVDDLVEVLKGQGLDESAVRWAIHEGRARGVFSISWNARSAVDPADDSGPVRNREGQFVQSTDSTKPCAVDLSGTTPRVFGVEQDGLPEKTKSAVQALLDAYPDGLSASELRERCSARDPVATLRDLRNSDPDWKQAILFPVQAKQGGTYRLAPDK